MVVSTLNSNGTGGRGKSKPILVDPAALEVLDSAEKNVQANTMVHPKLYASIIRHLSQIPANVIVEGETQTLKRTSYSQFIRQSLASAADYHGELVIVGTRGGNVIGIVSAFNTTVQSMFDMARSMGQLSGMAEDQIKQFAFAEARKNMQAHPQLASVEVSDDVLEKLWSGDLEDEDPDDEDTTEE